MTDKKKYEELKRLMTALTTHDQADEIVFLKYLEELYILGYHCGYNECKSRMVKKLF